MWRGQDRYGGRIFCAYDLNLDDDNRTVTTKGWVKEQIAAIFGLKVVALASSSRMTAIVSA